MIEILHEYWKPLLWTDGYRFTGVAITLWPVSYTHLDVYKRQSYRRWLDLSDVCQAAQISLLIG